MADTKAGGVFVEIGGRNEKLKAAYREAEAVTGRTLGAMGRKAAAFSSRFATALGVGAGGGLLAGAARSLQVTQELTRAMVTLAQQSALSGQDFAKVAETVDATADRMGPLTGLTRDQAAAMATWGLQARFAGKELKLFIERANALATLRGLDPVQVAQTVAATQISGGDLKSLGILTGAGTLSKDIRAAFERGGDAAIKTVGVTAVPGTLKQRLQGVERTFFQSIGELFREGFGGGFRSLQNQVNILRGAAGFSVPGRAPFALEERIGGAPDLSLRQRRELLRNIENQGRLGPLESLIGLGLGAFGDLLGAGTGAQRRFEGGVRQSGILQGLRDVGGTGPEPAVKELSNRAVEALDEMTMRTLNERAEAGITTQTGPFPALPDDSAAVRELRMVNENLEKLNTSVIEGGN